MVLDYFRLINSCPHRIILVLAVRLGVEHINNTDSLSKTAKHIIDIIGLMDVMSFLCQFPINTVQIKCDKPKWIRIGWNQSHAGWIACIVHFFGSSKQSGIILTFCFLSRFLLCFSHRNWIDRLPCCWYIVVVPLNPSDLFQGHTIYTRALVLHNSLFLTHRLDVIVSFQM